VLCWIRPEPSPKGTQRRGPEGMFGKGVLLERMGKHLVFRGLIFGLEKKGKGGIVRKSRKFSRISDSSKACIQEHSSE